MSAPLTLLSVPLLLKGLIGPFRTNLQDTLDTEVEKPSEEIVVKVDNIKINEGYEVLVLDAEVGDIIDRAEAIRFGLFPDINGFLWARYLLKLSDNTYWLEYWIRGERGEEIQKVNKVSKYGIGKNKLRQ